MTRDYGGLVDALILLSLLMFHSVGVGYIDESIWNEKDG